MNYYDAEMVIAEILDKFDFEKVHAVMLLTNWKWLDSHVPTVEELREAARQRLITVCRAEEIEASSMCGGLVASKSDNEIGLWFELECCAVTI